MENEQIAICDESGKTLGRTSREEIHKKGLWHETFHCWIVTEENGRYFTHLQIRSSEKKDFPGLLDITAAGHILADEIIEDGIREVEEELGIRVTFEELIPLGVIKDQIVQEGFIDNERCHAFLYVAKEDIDETYELQKEEVAGMVKTEFELFYALCFGALKEIEVFKIVPDKSKEIVRRRAGKKDLVPHSKSYLESVASLIKRELNKNRF